MQLNDLVNVLGSEYFKDDPYNRLDKNKAPLQVLVDPGVPMRKIWEMGIPFEISLVSSGRTTQGIAFASVNVTLVIGSQRYTVPGSSEGETPQHGIAGVQLQAINNALLRNFRMAEHQYQDTPELVNPSQNVSQPPEKGARVVTTGPVNPPPPPQTPSASAAPQKKQWNRPNNFKTSTQTKPKASGPPQSVDWTGEEIIDFGKKYNGTAWKNVPLDYLQYVTSGDKPNKKGQLEINRRLLLNPPDLQVDGDEPWSN